MLIFSIGILYLYQLIVAPVYVYFFNKPLVLHFYLFSKKLDPNHKQLLSDTFTFYRRLSPKKQLYFDHRVKSLVESLQFVSREQLDITFEMKLLIASTSTMLTFGMQKYLYTVIKIIIVYPSSFTSQTTGEIHLGEFNPKLNVLAFSWEDFYEGIRIDNNNLNLGIHEFSHALLFESLKKKGLANSSTSIFSDYYNEIILDLKNEETIKKLVESNYFRDYAYVNGVEFLAVILENFFETPEEFKIEFPELFQKVKTMINYVE